MKKIFTLLAFVLMAGSAFGQKNWTNVNTNYDLEGTVNAYETLDANSASAWNSFWVHEWLGDQSVRYDGTANVVEDPADPTNHCVKVVIRSRAEGEAAGNLTPDYTGNEGTYGSWDCQFFIYATDPIPVGKEIRLQLKVKADRAGKFETQNHSVPGTYIDSNAYGDQQYTTEWKTLKMDPFTVTQDQADKSFQTIAFNLCTDEDANVIYFDDIKLQIRDPQVDDGSDAGAWINFMRRGIYSMDHITGVGKVNGQDTPFECTNYTFQDLTKPEGEQQQPAPVVEVPGEPGVFAVHIPVQGYYSQEEDDLDEEGNPQTDDDGNVKKKTVYYWNDGTLVPGVNGAAAGSATPARWMCQFFVSTLHKMVKNEKFRFKFRCKADKATSLGTQAHYGPGQYKDYNTFGSESNFPVSTDWTTFELGDFDSVTDASKKVIPSNANGCQTITFDCVPLEGDDNNFYLIVEEFSFTEKYVTIEDRTLGTPEAIGLAVNMDEDEKANTVDMANMLNTFELTDFSFLKSGKDGIKLYTLIEPDDPEEDPTPSFSSLLPWTDGGFIGKDGLYIDDENGISIRLNDESIDGTKIDVMVWNNPDAGISFANGEIVNTKLAISQSGWYYVYNVILSADGTGIRDIQMNKNDGKIYDLMGRRVTNPTKGIYIQNGKKFIVK